MDNKHYYYDGTTILTKYATLWDGYLKYSSKDIIPDFHIVEDILVEICDINFYISVTEDHIYISLCQDSSYYAHQFEKHIKIVIKEFEDKFNISISNGKFNATEVKHQGDQYKYTITKDDISGRIILKKRVLNWDKKDGVITKSMNKLTI